MPNRPQIRAASLQKYSEVAHEFGVDAGRVLQASGLDRSLLAAPDVLISEQAFAELLEQSSSVMGTMDLGLRMGARWRISDFGHISLVLQHQASMAASLATLKEYRHLLSDTVVVDVLPAGDVALVQLRLATPNGRAGRHRMELGLSVLLSLFRFQLGRDWRPQSVHMSHGAPGQTLQHKHLLGSRLEFGSDFDGFAVALEELHRPHAEHDPQMEQHARFFLNAIPRRIDAVSDSLREAIKSLLPHGRHSMAGVAALMGYTARSMQRHLAQAGTSYQQALNEVRRQLAAELLADARHSVSDAAAATGFAEVSAFSRWFSAEFSCSPSAWRRLHAG